MSLPALYPLMSDIPAVMIYVGFKTLFDLWMTIADKSRLTFYLEYFVNANSRFYYIAYIIAPFRGIGLNIRNIERTQYRVNAWKLLRFINFPKIYCRPVYYPPFQISLIMRTRESWNFTSEDPWVSFLLQFLKLEMQKLLTK